METSDWSALPASSVASIAKFAGSTCSIAQVCMLWYRGIINELHPTKATADLSNEDLGPLPSWCQPTIKKVQLVVGPVPLSPAPHAPPSLPDHFGPGDARELCTTLARLELAAVQPLVCGVPGPAATTCNEPQSLSTAMPQTEMSVVQTVTSTGPGQATQQAAVGVGRTLRLCMCGTLVREQVLANLLLHSCPGLLDAWPQVEVVFESSGHAPDDPVQECLQHSIYPPSPPSCSSGYMLMCGSLSTHLTVCHLSSGFAPPIPSSPGVSHYVCSSSPAASQHAHSSPAAQHPTASSVLATHPAHGSPAAGNLPAPRYPHLRSLGLCIDDAATSALPPSSGIVAPTLPAPAAWVQLLQGAVLPLLQSLALHTGPHVVQLPAAALTSLTTLQSLVVTGAGLDIVLPHISQAGAATAAAAGTGAAAAAAGAAAEGTAAAAAAAEGTEAAAAAAGAAQHGTSTATEPLSVAECIAALPHPTKLRYDGFAATHHPISEGSNLGSASTDTEALLVGALLGESFQSTPLPPKLSQLTMGVIRITATACSTNVAPMEVDDAASNSSMQLEKLRHLTLQVLPPSTVLAGSRGAASVSTLDFSPILQRAPHLQRLTIIHTPGVHAVSSILLPQAHTYTSLKKVVLSALVLPAVQEVLEPAPELSPSGPYDYPGEPYPKQQADTGSWLLNYLSRKFLQPLVSACPQLQEMTFLDATCVPTDQQAGRMQHRCPVRSASDLRHAFPSHAQGAAAGTQHATQQQRPRLYDARLNMPGTSGGAAATTVWQLHGTAVAGHHNVHAVKDGCCLCGWSVRPAHTKRGMAP